MRRFVEKEKYPHEEAVDRLGYVPEEIGRRIGARGKELGLYACNLPEEVGRGGLGYARQALVEREYGRTSHALRSGAARPTELLMACEGAQRERYLFPAVRGEKRELFSLTEPDAGSDVMGMKTNARREGDDWILNGAKHFISGPCRPDFAIVFAATGADETPCGPRKRSTAYLVDPGMPGYGAAIVTQSGMFSSDNTMSQRSLPMAYMVSAGNQAVLGIEEFPDTFAEDAAVRAIGLHIEGLRDLLAFERGALKALRRGIPVVALKTGSSSIGATLTVSHTGSLSGASELYEALFARLGVEPARLHHPDLGPAGAHPTRFARAFEALGADLAMVVQDYPAEGLDTSKIYYENDAGALARAARAASRRRSAPPCRKTSTAPRGAG